MRTARRPGRSSPGCTTLGLGPVTLCRTIAIPGLVGYLAVSRKDVAAIGAGECEGERLGEESPVTP